VGTARTLRPNRLGEKLAAIRQHFNLSQNELIRKLGFQNVLLREEISSFERDVRVPPPLVLLAYGRLANTHVENLLDDTLEVELIRESRMAATGKGQRSKKSQSRKATSKQQRRR
jgi:transcriptional regulator with XRE-family HTH domain